MYVWVLGPGDSFQTLYAFIGRRVGFVSLRKNASLPPTPPTICWHERESSYVGTQRGSCLLSALHAEGTL